MDVREERLVLAAQAGDMLAFDRLLRRYEVTLYRHIVRMIGDQELAYVVLQDTYLAIVKNIKNLRSRPCFRAWAFGVATRTSLKAISRRQSSRRLETLDMDMANDDSLDQFDLVSFKDKIEKVERLVLDLSPRLLSVFLLHFFEELTLGEVAASLEISIGTVKSRLAAGLTRLRAQLEGGAG
jgi:RNA polymerase sigma-70 factor, ECF subfamily